MNNIKIKLKEFFDKLKVFWGKFSKKMKILIISIIAVLIIAAVGVTLLLNKSDGYIVLFPGMSSAETTEVYLELMSKNVAARINSNGEIEVLETEWDNLVFELAQLGYPQSTPSYSMFFENISMTMTEFEKEQTLRFELQDRLQTTISRINGVKSAIVTISFPKKSDYVWQDTKEKASASVLLSLYEPEKFTAENVSAIKKLVSYSAQLVEFENVTVSDTSTGKELFSEEELETEDSINVEDKVKYEERLKKQLEDNAQKLLLEGLFYKEDKVNVVAVATVKIDWDKVIREAKELITNEDGEGVKKNQQIEYKTEDELIDPNETVGENDNTDEVITYENPEDGITNEDATHYKRDTEWAIGEILTQTERAPGVLSNATISVIINAGEGVELNIPEEQVMNLVRNATNIPNENITVYLQQKLAEIVPEVPEDTEKELNALNREKLYIILGLALAVILIIILLIIFVMHKVNKRKLRIQKQQSDEAIRTLQQAIDDSQVVSISEAAEMHHKQEKDVANEVRTFVKKNPEITAAIIRSMLKEDEL